MGLIEGLEGVSFMVVPVSVDAAGNVNINALSLPSLPAGTNNIGSVGLLGYWGGGWKRSPIPFGASSDTLETWQNLSLPAGASNQDSTALTANAFSVFNTWAVKYTGTVANVVLTLVRVSAGTTEVVVTEFRNLVSGAWYSWQGFLLCKATDILRVKVAGATLNDDLVSNVNGYYYSNTLVP